MKPRHSIFLVLGISCVVCLLASLIGLAAADFESNDIDETYVLDLGSKSNCPEELAFDDGLLNSLQIKPKEIEVNGEKCEAYPSDSDAELLLSDDHSSGSSATKFLVANRADIGDILSGNVSGGQIACGGINFDEGEEFIFMQPDDEFTFKFVDLFGKNDSRLQLAGIEEATVKEDWKYALVGDRCLYREKGLADRVCFPADATVITPHGNLPMNRVQSGQVVLTADGKWESVLGFTHKDSAARAEFVQLHTDTHGILTATPGHYVYVVKNEAEQLGEVLIRMDHVKTNDRLVHSMSGTFPRVIKTTRSLRIGVYNPHTASGIAVVNGFKASCYTAAVQPAAAHALLAPMRVASELAWRTLTATCALFQSS